MLRQQIGDQLRTFARTVKAANQPLSDAIEKHETVVLVKLQAARSNSGTIYIGDANHQLYELTAGEKEDFPVTRLNQIYFKGTAGDRLIFIVISTTGESTPPVGP